MEGPWCPVLRGSVSSGLNWKANELLNGREEVSDWLPCLLVRPYNPAKSLFFKSLLILDGFVLLISYVGLFLYTPSLTLVFHVRFERPRISLTLFPDSYSRNNLLCLIQLRFPNELP